MINDYREAVFFAAVPGVTPSEVSTKIKEGWTLVDVRTDDEWAMGRIAGSAHIPMDELVARLDEVGDHVICVCAVGARSAQVAEYLNMQGREAVNLDGGIYAWTEAGLPLHSGP